MIKKKTLQVNLILNESLWLLKISLFLIFPLLSPSHSCAVTGTDKDLRKLSMKEMARMLEEYGVKKKQISNLARWDRVHMIRELSTKAASDNAGDGMERYARGEKVKLKDKIDSYKKRIQEIWERQRAFLRETEDETNPDKAEEKEDNNKSDDDDEDDDEDDDDDDEDIA